MNGDFCQPFPHIMNKMFAQEGYFSTTSLVKTWSQFYKNILREGNSVFAEWYSVRKPSRPFTSLFIPEQWPRLLDSNVLNRPFASCGLLILTVGSSVLNPAKLGLSQKYCLEWSLIRRQNKCGFGCIFLALESFCYYSLRGWVSECQDTELPPKARFTFPMLCISLEPL